MKNWILRISILITLFSTAIVGQDNSALDLKAKVKAQMLKAQNNMPMVEKNEKTENSSFYIPNISTGMFRVLILFLSSIIVLSLVFLRRVKIQEKEITKQFKENIRLIREESLRQPIDYSLTPIRKSLLQQFGDSLEERAITVLARKLKIAKGEILLANSIKNYATESNMAGNKA